MQKTQVVNLTFEQPYDVYIGREGRGRSGFFGNPFPLPHESKRIEILQKYEAWFYQRLKQDPHFKNEILLLRGKRLGCFCAPRLCHGHIIADYLDHERLPMKEANTDLFGLMGLADWACITTNGAVTKADRAVMGRGCALRAKQLWPDIDRVLANLIRTYGNVPNFLGFVDHNLFWTMQPTPDRRWTHLWSFPVKHLWHQQADLELIVQSAVRLRDQVMTDDIEVVIPRPGCGNGRLSWEEVGPALKAVLDNRFTIVTNE